MIGHIHMHHDGNQDVADDGDGDIGWEVVGAVQVELLAADIAIVRHLEVGPEHLALAAMRALAERATPHGLAYAAGFNTAGLDSLRVHLATSFSGPWDRRN
ncbi:hypothetical protein D9M68_911760 [compost metagenome]